MKRMFSRRFLSMRAIPRNDYSALIFPRQMDSRRSHLPDGTSITFDAAQIPLGKRARLVRRHRQRMGHRAEDVLPPGVELVDGEAVFAVDLVVQLLAGVRRLSRRSSTARFRRSETSPRSAFRPAGRGAGRGTTHLPSCEQSSGEALSPSTICTRIDRWLAFCVLNTRLAATGRAVLRGMRIAFRGRPVLPSMATTPRLCELTFLILNAERPPSRAGQNDSRVQCRAVGHRFVGRDRGVGLFARDLLEHRPDHRHAGRAADQQHAVDLLPGAAGGLQRLPRGEPSAIEQVVRDLLELLAGDFRPDRRSFEVVADGGLAAERKRALGVFAFAPQPAGGVRIFAGIDAGAGG